MSHNKIIAISSAFIAFSTFLGVGGALVYYFDQILNLSSEKLLTVALLYILSCLVFIKWLRGKLN